MEIPPVRPASRTGWRLGVVVALALIFALGAPTANAQPHEEESEFAVDLVQQAISFIANDGGADRALEKMGDALMAPDPTGVDLALVEEAIAVVEDAGPGAAQDEALGQARELLLEAAPELAEPPAVEMARGLATGTTVVLDRFQPARGVSDGGDAVLLALAGVVTALGLWLARRLRPHHTIRQLRRLGLPEPRTAKQEGTS